jgi:hypothetical protein
VADRRALFVAIDTFLDPTLGAVPYAETAAKAVADALTRAGYPKANQTLLLGQHATVAAVESRVRKIRKACKKGDAVLVWVCTRGFSRGGANVLAAWDTIPDDLTDTSVSLTGVLKELTTSKASQIILLLDVGAGPLPSAADREVIPHLDPAELERLFGESAKAVCLTAATGDEESHQAAALRSSVWSHAVTDALTGRAAKAVATDHTITTVTLQRHLEAELPRLLRKHFDGRAEQTPAIYGEQNAVAVIADLTALIGGRSGVGLLDPARLKRVAFRSESGGRVKDLTGFRKTFRLPDHAGPSARKFVAKCATDDLRADLDAVFEAVREHLRYKRKDVETTLGTAGVGSLRTPDFEYTVSINLDPHDPTQVVWQREVGQFNDLGVVRGEAFAAAFGRLFDQLTFEFAVPVDVGELVDRLEDHPAAGVTVSASSDGAACEVTLAGFAGAVRVERDALTVRGRTGDAAGLLDQFLAFVNKVGPLGEPLALTGG